MIGYTRGIPLDRILVFEVIAGLLSGCCQSDF